MSNQFLVNYNNKKYNGYKVYPSFVCRKCYYLLLYFTFLCLSLRLFSGKNITKTNNSTK